MRLCIINIKKKKKCVTKVLVIEDNKGGECIQEPAYDQYVEEVDAHIEKEEDLSL